MITYIALAAADGKLVDISRKNEYVVYCVDSKILKSSDMIEMRTKEVSKFAVETLILIGIY